VQTDPVQHTLNAGCHLAERVFCNCGPHKYKNSPPFDREAGISTEIRWPFRQAEPDETAARMIECEELR
jgi:hypothetical protein